MRPARSLFEQAVDIEGAALVNRNFRMTCPPCFVLPASASLEIVFQKERRKSGCLFVALGGGAVEHLAGLRVLWVDFQRAVEL